MDLLRGLFFAELLIRLFHYAAEYALGSGNRHDRKWDLSRLYCFSRAPLPREFSIEPGYLCPP